MYVVWAMCIYSLEFNGHFVLGSRTRNRLPPPPTHKNQKLQQMINENKDKSVLYLSNEQFIDDDMEIVSFYLLRSNKVRSCQF